MKSVNSTVLDRYSNERKVTYLSADSISDLSTSSMYPTEFLNTLCPSGLPPHKLTLCPNTPIILLRNLDPKRGLLNGTRLRVINLGTRIIEAEIKTGKCVGSIVFIPRITITPSDSGLPFELRRRQFPIRPSFALTINKSQGQTLKFVGIDLKHHVFSHGQLYVALSRVGSFSQIKILPDKKIDDHFYTTNIVYGGIL